MTWERIEYFPDCEGHLVDGYLPDRDEVRQLQQSYRHLKPGEEFGLLRGFDQSRDMAYLELADAMAQYEMQELDHRPDPWYAAILEPTAVARAPPYSAFTAEIGADVSADHRVLVVLSGAWPNLSRYMTRLVKQTGLRFKNSEQYKNYEAFRRDCNAMLEDVLEVFMAPRLLAEKKLSTSGLRVSGVIE